MHIVSLPVLLCFTFANFELQLQALSRRLRENRIVKSQCILPVQIEVTHDTEMCKQSDTEVTMTQVKQILEVGQSVQSLLCIFLFTCVI